MRIYGWVGSMSDPDFARLTESEVNTARVCHSNMYVRLEDYELVRDCLDRLATAIARHAEEIKCTLAVIEERKRG